VVVLGRPEPDNGTVVSLRWTVVPALASAVVVLVGCGLILDVDPLQSDEPPPPDSAAGDCDAGSCDGGTSVDAAPDGSTGCTASCGDGVCCAAAGEDACSCAGDCGAGSCGDGVCCAAAGEDTCSCALDCGARSGVLITTGNPTVGVGTTFTLYLSACLPVISWTINWGDGSIVTFAGNPSSVPHTYTRAGYTFNILASVVSAGTTILQNQLVIPSGGNDTVQWFDQTGVHLMGRGPGAGVDYQHTAVIGPDGLLYVAAYRSDNVLRYHPTTGVFIDEFVPAGSGGLSTAVGMAFGPDGNLYVAGLDTSEVLRFNGSTGEFIDEFVPAGLGGLDETEGVVFGPDDNLYVSDFSTDAVYKYDGTIGASMGVFVSTRSGGLRDPEDLTFGPDGNLYVASERTNQVLRFD